MCQLAFSVVHCYRTLLLVLSLLQYDALSINNKIMFTKSFFAPLLFLLLLFFLLVI